MRDKSLKKTALDEIRVYQMDFIVDTIRLILIKPGTSGLLHLYWALGSNLFLALTAVSVGAFVMLLPYTLRHNRNVFEAIHRRAQHNDLRRRHRNHRTYRKKLDALAEAKPIRRHGNRLYLYFLLIGYLLYGPIQVLSFAQGDPEEGLARLAEYSFISASQLQGVLPMNSEIGVVDLLQHNSLLACAAILVTFIVAIVASAPDVYPARPRLGLTDLFLAFTIGLVTAFAASGLAFCFIVMGSLYLMVAVVQNGTLVTRASLSPFADKIFPEKLQPQQKPTILDAERREERRVRRRARRRRGARR